MNCCAEWTTCAEAAPGSKTIAAAVPAAMRARRRCLLSVRDVMFRCSSSFEISPREGGTAAPSGAVDPSYLAIATAKLTRGVGDLRASRYRVNEVRVGADTSGGPSIPRTVTGALIETPRTWRIADKILRNRRPITQTR